MASIQRLKAAEEKISTNEIKTQQKLTSMRTEVTGVMTSINELSAKMDLLMQRTGGNKTQTDIPPVEVPMEHQVEDEHQDREEQAWYMDARDKRMRTEQFQPTSNVTDIQAIERNINLGNTIFTSYAWVADQIEAALKSRQKQDATYSIGTNVSTTVTPDAQQEKGNKQKKAINTKLRTIIWNGQCPILEWVKLFCDALRGYSVSALTLEERNMLPWDSIHQDKQQELDHIRPGTPSFEHDTMPAYVARIVSIYEPELYSEQFRNIYESRKQMRQESATRYVVNKWFLYRRAEPVVNWRQFVNQAINGLVCFKLKSRLRERMESINDLGKFQSLLFRHISLLRTDIMDPSGDGGSLAGLKVTQYDRSFKHDANGTQPMDVSAVEEPDVDFGQGDLEVAVLERRAGCYNCGKYGHIKSQCEQPPKKTEPNPRRTEQAKPKEEQRKGPIVCNKCNKKGHSARKCVCQYCMNPGHSEEDCRIKKKDEAGFH